MRNADFQVISIHTPLAGSDGYGSSQSSPERNFNPHSPCGERPSGEWITWASSHYFNPHSPCGERRGLAEMLEVLDISIHTPLAGSDVDMLDINDIHVISIHTPLAGSDRKTLKTSANSWNFNPHSPCGERQEDLENFRQLLEFQSTLPLRGATLKRFNASSINKYFNPHSPCGERRVPLTYASCICQFQSTLPLRGATGCGGSCRLAEGISIHTPLAGSDDLYK